MNYYLCLRPSISVRSWETILLSTSPWVFSLFGAIESTSSMKMIAGEFFSASSKALRRFDSDSPASLDIISGPLIRKKNAPVSLATALAIKVLPVPGGPNRRIPRGGFTPIAWKVIMPLNQSRVFTKLILKVCNGNYKTFNLVKKNTLKSVGCLNGSSTISLIWANCFLHPPMSSYLIKIYTVSYKKHLTIKQVKDVWIALLYDIPSCTAQIAYPPYDKNKVDQLTQLHSMHPPHLLCWQVHPRSE